jgi:hypothetical protein
MLNDEDTDQETGGQWGERQGEPVGHVVQQIHRGAGGEKAPERGDCLGEAFAQYGRLEAPRKVAEVRLFVHDSPLSDGKSAR